jgi:hypothetical protein
VCANDDAAGAGYEVPVAQPSGTGPAIDDQGWWPGNPPPASVSVHLTTLFVGGTFVWLWLTGGSWVVLLLLGIATVLGLLVSGTEPLLRREMRRRSGMLQQQSWRAATVRVFSWGDGGKHLLLVDEGCENPLRMRTYGFDRVDQKMIMARTRRIWLVGPDAKGEYLYCVAGSCIPPLFAWVVDEQPPEDSEVMVEQAAPALLANAADDVVATWGLERDWNRRAIWWVLLVAGSILIGSVVLSGVLLSTGAEHAIESIAALGVLLVFVVPFVVFLPRMLCLLGRITRLRSTGPWTSVSATMHDPVGPDKRRLRTYRGVATMPDGRTVSVGVHTMNSLAANIAATGLLWIVGEPTPGRAFAVGLPGYPHIGIGRFGR